MRNWKSTIGGAFSAFGTTLMGCGIIPQLAGSSSKFLTIMATVGFICTALGQFFANLFSADASTVKNLKEQVNENTAAVSVLKGNTPPPLKPESK